MSDDGSDQLELYNLRDDLGESRNLAAEKPELVRELNALITGFLKNTDAVVPIRNPNYRPGAAKQPAAKAGVSADPLQGWKARICDAAVEGGIVTVTSKGTAPFLGVGAGKAAGATEVSFRARSASGGAGKVEWIPPGQAAKPAQATSVSFVLAGGEWREVTVKLPAQGPLGIVRLYLPAEKEPVQLDWVELKSVQGQPQHWDF